ncbi:Membrane-associated protein vipp1, chloroplastic [Orobanche hederae]
MAMAVKAPITGISMGSCTSAPSGASCNRGVIIVKAQPLRASLFGRGAGTPKYGGMLLSCSRRPRFNNHRTSALGTQMSLIGRFARVVKSYANALVSLFEDPEKILDQSVDEMNTDLVKMRQATAQILSSQKQMENKYKAAEKASEDWYQRAQLALGKGDEDLAREALKRRKSYADNANSLKAQLDQHKAVTDNLIANTRLLESKIQEAKSKKDSLKARAQSAKTAAKVSDMLGNVNTSNALAAFAKMEEKVLAMESQAEALNQLTSDELEGKFAMLETSSVDDDLADLKKQLSGNTKAPLRDSFHQEELRLRA